MARPRISGATMNLAIIEVVVLAGLYFYINRGD